MTTPGKAPHPGKILKKKFMAPHNLSATALALALRVAPNRMTNIVRGRRGVTAETAIRLALYFRNTPEYWLGLQTAFEISKAEKETGAKIRKQVIPRGPNL